MNNETVTPIVPIGLITCPTHTVLTSANAASKNNYNCFGNAAQRRWRPKDIITTPQATPHGRFYLHLDCVKRLLGLTTLLYDNKGQIEQNMQARR